MSGTGGKDSSNSGGGDAGQKADGGGPTVAPLTVKNVRAKAKESKKAATGDGDDKSRNAAAATTSASGVGVGASSTEFDLSQQSREFLLQRCMALERQLRIRNADCARLLEERQNLLPLRQKCAAQAEMVAELEDRVVFLKAQKESALEALERMRRQQRDDEHNARFEGFYDRMANDGVYSSRNYSAPPSRRPTVGPEGGGSGKIRITGITPSSPAGSQQQQQQQQQQSRVAPGGTVVNTSAGPQIIYDSSDISSVGFQPRSSLPIDFLGGSAAQLQYCRPQGAQRGVDGSDAAQADRVMNMAMDSAQADRKRAEMEADEEEQLRARIAALRRK